MAQDQRLDGQAEVWGRFWKDQDATANFQGQELIQAFVKEHFQFGFDNLIRTLAAGQTVGQLMMALRGTAQGREMCSRELDDLIRIAAARQGPKFLFQYLPSAVAKFVRLFLELRTNASKELIHLANQSNENERTELSSAPQTAIQDIMSQIRAAYPDLSALEDLSAGLDQNIQAARPTLRAIANLIAAKELVDELLNLANRLKVRIADPDDEAETGDDSG
ncbi:hypothetical protein KJ611_01860 [Patescibacteria group bacterium]|nr:hypothetical protein [Patescibacteria group bacterium]